MLPEMETLADSWGFPCGASPSRERALRGQRICRLKEVVLFLYDVQLLVLLAFGITLPGYSVNTCIHIYIYIFMYIHVSMYIYIYIYIYKHIYVSVRRPVSRGQRHGTEQCMIFYASWVLWLVLFSEQIWPEPGCSSRRADQDLGFANQNFEDVETWQRTKNSRLMLFNDSKNPRPFDIWLKIQRNYRTDPVQDLWAWDGGTEALAALQIKHAYFIGRTAERHGQQSTWQSIQDDQMM